MEKMELFPMDTNSKSSNNAAVVLVSHGSSLPYAEETFNEIKAKFIESTGLPTEIGYMKVSEPSISGAIDILKSENPDLKRVLALPVFLAAGIHTNIDIPILLGLDPLETDPRCPDGDYPDDHYLSIADPVDFNGEITLIPPIGPHDSILDIINKRIDEALSDSEKDDAATAILLVSHGSRLGYNKEFISEVQSKFDEICELPNTYGFMELAEPNIPTSINKLLSENEGIERLVVVPVFIAPGVHTTSDIPTILGLKEHSHEHGHDHHHHHHHDLEAIDFDGEILYGEPICADDILIDILKEKIEDAL